MHRLLTYPHLSIFILNDFAISGTEKQYLPLITEQRYSKDEIGSTICESIHYKLVVSCVPT